MKNILLLFIIMIPFYSFSQVKINGIIKDQAGLIAKANVVLSNNNKQVVKELLTSQEGTFEFVIPKGNYIITVNHPDYESFVKEFAVEENIQFDNIFLEKKANALQEVVINNSGNLVKRKLDKTVFSVQNSPIASTGNAFDALKRTPGLILKNDQITMLGRSGVKVMVEGKMVQLSGDELKNFLATLSATDIKEIEIIANPSSKYEAEGNSGIVNIIFKKSKKDSWSDNISITHSQAKYGRESINNSFNFRKNKVNLTFSAGYDAGRIFVDQRVEIAFKDEPLKLRTLQKRDERNFSPRLLFDYDATKNTKIGMQYTSSFAETNIGDRSTAQLFNPNYDITAYLKGKAKFDIKKNNHLLNFFLENKLDTLGRKMVLNFDIMKYDQDMQNNIISNRYDSDDNFSNIDFANNTKTKQSIMNYNAKLDFEHPTKFANFQYGTKISFISTEYNTDTYDLITGSPVYDPQLSDNFKYQENIQALYINGTKKINSKMQVQLGFRAEYTQTEGESMVLNQVDRNEYFKLFPTVFLSYQKNENNVYVFNYGKRIERPNYSLLNPLRYFVNSKVSSQGNPHLQPAYTDNFEFSHTYKDNLNSKLSFRVKTNAFGLIFNLDEVTQEQLIIKENFYDNYGFSLTESYQLKLFSWWKTDNTLFFNYSYSKKTDENINATVRNGLEFYGSVNNVFTFDKAGKILGELNVDYNSPYNDNLYKYSQASSIDLAFTYKSIFKNLNLSAGVFDIFNSSSRRMYSEVNNVKQNYISYPSNRYFRVSLNYMFGNDKIKSQKRNFGNEEERKRSN